MPAHRLLPFDLPFLLRGRLVDLRPLTPGDADALFAAASDPLIWEQHPEPDRYRPEIFQHYFAGALESQGAFAILNRNAGEIIGSSRYCNWKAAEHEIEIGWTFLQRPFWGGAYNRELKSLMLDYAFTPRPGEEPIERVVFVVGENNIRSQRALEKIGARFLRRNVTLDHNGRHCANLVFAITR